MRGVRCRSSAARANRSDYNGFSTRALSGTEVGCGAPVGGWFSHPTHRSLLIGLYSSRRR